MTASRQQATTYPCQGIGIASPSERDTSIAPTRRAPKWIPSIILGLALAGGALYYTQSLTRWLAYDDEGGYLYAAWRIGLGELPYRDFLTPQLPAFLYPGAWVLAATDLSVAAARASMTVYVLGVLLLTALTVRRIWGLGPALLSLCLLLPQQDIFWAARFYRPEAPMLFWSALGLYLFAVGYSGSRRWILMGAGVCLGLGVLSKLFGALTIAGIGLYLVARLLRRETRARVLTNALLVGLPCAMVVLGTATVYQLLTERFVAAVLGHHLRQGSGTPWAQVLSKATRLYVDYIVAQPVFVALAALGALCIVLRRLRPGRVADSDCGLPIALGGLYIAQVPTVAAFALMTRSLQARHLTYLVPSLSALGGVAMWRAWMILRGRDSAKTPLRVAAGLVVLAIVLSAALLPSLQHNAWVASWGNADTASWAEYIRAHTSAGEHVMSDYPGLNFFARRPAPPTAAGISRGAALSGQITGAQLIGEIADYDVDMVLLNIAHGSHQFVNLQDYVEFKRYIQTQFHLAERRPFDYRLMEIYARDDLFPGQRTQVHLGGQLALTGIHWLRSEVAPCGVAQVELRWQSLAPMPTDYWVTLRLLDDEGHEWGLGGKRLVDIDRETWWDERGLEQAVLIPTSQWPVSEATLQTYELPIAPGTPPGSYRAVLRVHPEGQWGGLVASSAESGPIGYDVPLGDVSVLPSKPDGGSLPEFDRQVDVEVVDGLFLVGYSVPTAAVRPGDRLPTKLCWRADNTLAKDYGVHLALRREDDTLSEIAAPVGGARYPTSAWRPGECVCGQYSPRVDRQAEEGAYAVELTILDGETPRWAQDVGEIEVTGREHSYVAPDPSSPIAATLGDDGYMTLVGYDLDPAILTPGGELTITLYWQGLGAMDTSYTAFVHLLDEAGRLRAQSDAIPCSGECPTTSWRDKEFLADTHRLDLPSNLPEGAYQLSIGAYDGATGLRLPIRDADGTRLPDDRLLLPTRLSR